MLLRLVTAPASEPVTLAEAKAHLRLDTSLDDAYVQDLITAARQYCEKVCWRGLITQQYELALPGFIGDDRFELPDRRHASIPQVGYEWSNVSSAYRYLPYFSLLMGELAPAADVTAIDPSYTPVMWVKYVDPDGNTQTVPTTVYDVDSYSKPARVRLAYGQSWPITRDQWNAATIRYWVGWTVGNLPRPLKQAVLIIMAQMYEHRTFEVLGRMTSPVQFSFDALVEPYRLNTVG